MDYLKIYKRIIDKVKNRNTTGEKHHPLPRSKIASRLGVSKSTIYRRLKANGITHRKSIQ